MEAHAVEGRLLGTFHGKLGDQFQLMGAKVDVLLSGSYVDEENDERIFELTFRGHKPVDEFRLRLDLPEHGFRNLVDNLESELQD